MPPVTFTWPAFYTRIKDVDPDLRAMALFDLQTELEKDGFQLGTEADNCTTKLIACFGKEENNSDVHSQALRLVPVYVPKIDANRRKQLFEHLCATSYIKHGSDITADKARAMRDNAISALKAAIPILEGPFSESAAVIAQGLLPGLKADDVKVRVEVFGVLGELVRALGKHVAQHHAAIITAAIAAISEPNEMLCKKAVACLAAASPVCGIDEFTRTMDFTVNGLKTLTGEKQRRHLQLLSAVSRSAGARFASHLGAVMPLLFAELQKLERVCDSDDGQSRESNDTRENILQALENIITRCPLQITESLPEIIKYAAALVTWDPNYCEDPDAEDDDDADDEDLLDGDDNSWKVRKSAVKCLFQLAKTRPDALRPVLLALIAPGESGAPLVISRFNERVENVRLEVLDLFRALIAACRVGSGATHQQHGDAAVGSSRFGFGSFVVRGEEPLRPEAQLLHPLRNDVVKALLRSGKHKSVKVKLAVHTLLQDLFTVMGRDLSEGVAGSAQLIATHLSDAKLALPQLRPAVLEFARTLVQVTYRLATASEDMNLVSSVLSLLEPTVKCTEEKYYRTVVAALKALNEFVPYVAIAPNATQVAQKIFSALFTRLSATDADQEVRRAAMEALALLLREAEKPLAASNGADVQKSFDLIVALLKGETTRVSAARAVTSIQRCALTPAHLNAIATELTAFLRKLDRQVREQGLRSLSAFIGVHSAKIDAPILTAIVAELTNPGTDLLSEKELYITVLALQLGKAISVVPSVNKVAAEKLAPGVLKLLGSPLTQGQAVTEAGDLLRLLARDASVSGSLFSQAITAMQGAADEAAIYNLGTAVGVLCTSEQDLKKRASNVDTLVKLVSSAKKEVAVGAVVSLGEAGRWVSIVSAGAAANLEAALSSPVEEVKAAAATAVGRAASRECGADLLEKLVKNVASETPELLMRLRALRECFVAMISDHSSSAALQGLANTLLASLINHAGSVNESVAEATAECIGRLAQAQPAVIPAATAQLASMGDKRCAIVLGAMRFTMPHQASPQLDEKVRQHLPALLEYLGAAQPPGVRRAALQLFTAAAYNRPAFINEPTLRDIIFPKLLESTIVDPKLITTVDLGPFKHTTDHGADVRKQAFECLSVLTESLGRPESMLDAVDKFDDVAKALVRSLAAPETDFDIWSLARLCIVRLARTTNGAAAVVANADVIATNLKGLLGLKVKEGQEKDRVDEANRGAAICAYRLAAVVPALNSVVAFADLVKAVDAAAFAAEAKKAAADE